jgi:hypothetical protein
VSSLLSKLRREHGKLLAMYQRMKWQLQVKDAVIETCNNDHEDCLMERESLEAIKERLADAMEIAWSAAEHDFSEEEWKKLKVSKEWKEAERCDSLAMP